MDFQAVISSAAVPVTQDDSLVVELRYLLSNADVITVRLLQLDDNSNLIASVEQITLDPFQTSASLRIKLTSGILAQFSIGDQGGQAAQGQLFAQAYLQRGPTNAVTQQIYLTSGYVSDGNVLTYPTQQRQDSAAAAGPLQLANYSSNGPGTEIAANLNGGESGYLHSYRFTFTADATVAIRRIRIRDQMSGDILTEARNRTDIIATQAWTFYGWHGPNMPADDTVNLVGYFPCVPGLNIINHNIASETANLQADDLFSDFQVMATRQLSI